MTDAARMERGMDWIEYEAHRMKPGQHLEVSALEFNRQFPCGWPSIYETHEQSFLSKMIGSAWGTYRICRRFDVYIISRHEEGNRRVYVDPDQEHLFEKDDKGYYIPKVKP